MHKMLKNRSIWTTIVGLTLVLSMLVMTGYNQDDEAQAQVGGLATPAHNRNPEIAKVGIPVILGLDADDLIERHFSNGKLGAGLVVYDPGNFDADGPQATFPGDCDNSNVLPPPTADGRKWELRADTDNDGSFSDAGGFQRVKYNLKDAADIITINNFGDGGFVTFAPVGTAEVIPSSPLGGYKWQEVNGSNNPIGAAGNDSVGVAGKYLFASCGREGITADRVGEADVPTGGTGYFGSTEFTRTPGTVQKIVKTIHAEKQRYDSFLPQGNIPVIVDVTIIAEIWESLDLVNGQPLPPLKKEVIVVTCIKIESRPSVLECNVSVPPKGSIPVANCVEVDVQYKPWMNTVIGKIVDPNTGVFILNTAFSGNIVKTIAADKEVFECELPDGTKKKVDLLLFTEIWENLNNLSSDPIITKTFESLRCITKVDTTTFDKIVVEACQFRKVS